MVQKTKIALPVVFLLLASCGNTEDTPAVTDSTDSTPVAALPVISDFQETVFELGATYHLTDSCAFYFECDCCHGHLIFNADSTYYYRDFCVADQSLSDGVYSVSNDTLTLQFSGNCTKLEYNWDAEFDSIAIPYNRSETTFEPSANQYIISWCNEKIMLTAIGKEFTGMKTDADYQNEVEELRAENLLPH